MENGKWIMENVAILAQSSIQHSDCDRLRRLPRKATAVGVFASRRSIILNSPFSILNYYFASLMAFFKSSVPV